MLIWPPVDDRGWVRNGGSTMATKTAEDWRTADTDGLIDAVLRLETPDEAARFLRDLCTLGELRDLAQRWAVVRRLDAGEHYAAISRETGASTATITRIASWLNHGEGGYREALDRLAAARKAGIPYPARNER
jgi:TrpR-related protein YerC/YecD